jgi:hypothetical protein
MKAADKNMIHVRLEPETLKKLKIISIQRGMSMQEFVSALIMRGVDKPYK